MSRSTKLSEEKLSGIKETEKVLSPIPEIYDFIVTKYASGLWSANCHGKLFEYYAGSLGEVIANLMNDLDENANFGYTEVQLEDDMYKIQLIKREGKHKKVAKKDKKKNIETIETNINVNPLDTLYGKDTQTREDLPTPEPVDLIEDIRKAPDTYAYKLFRLCNMEAETKEPQPYLAAWQALNLVRLLLDKKSKGTFVKFSKSNIQESPAYFCSSDEGSCVANDLLTEAIAKHVLSCMHILDVADIKHALTYTRERDLDA